MRTCKQCGLSKPEADWRKNGSKFRSYCIVCERECNRLRLAKKNSTIEGKIANADRSRMNRAIGKAANPLHIGRTLEPGKTNKRNKLVVTRTPAWASQSIMDAMYATAKYMSETTGTKYVVDHVLPLRGALVSGLHTHFNLQIMTYDQNRRKGAFFRSK